VVNVNTVIPEIWQTRPHYKQHCSAVQENMPSGQTPGFATFDPNHKTAY